MLILTKADIEKVFTMRDAIDADIEALKFYTEGKSIVPLRTNINIEKSQGQSLFMPAYVDGVHATGVKIVSVFPNNIEKGLTSVPASMVLMDADTGFVNCIMDGTYVTQIRTGAVSGAATELLANQDAKIMALFGTGGQAKGQLEAVLTVRKIEEVRVFDLSYERAAAFAEEMTKDLGHYGATIIPVKTSDECIENADIITTVTTAPVPTFDGSKVKKGAHINGVGSYTPDKREIDENAIQAASVIYFDTLDGVWAEAGDFVIPLNEGKITKETITGELGQLILGQTPGRKTKEDITLFKTVGTAVLDVVTAAKIYKKAKKMGIGQEIEI